MALGLIVTKEYIVVMKLKPRGSGLEDMIFLGKRDRIIFERRSGQTKCSFGYALIFGIIRVIFSLSCWRPFRERSRYCVAQNKTFSLSPVLVLSIEYVLDLCR